MVAEYYSPPHRDEKFPDSPPHLWGEIIKFQKMRPRWGAEYPFSPHLGEENMKISKITQIFGACGAENLIFDPKLRHF